MQFSTVPISFVNRLLEGAAVEASVIQDLVAAAGIEPDLLGQRAARVTEGQYAALFRKLAVDMDDEMLGLFSRPARNGTLKFICLSLLDAPNLKVALYRFSRVIHIVFDDFSLDVTGTGSAVRVAIVPRPPFGKCPEVGQELMLKLFHGVISWLIARKIPLQRVDFAFDGPPRMTDYLYLYPGPVCFHQPLTAFYFDPCYLDAPIRRTQSELRAFLLKAPEDWIFVSFADKNVTQLVREHLEHHLLSASDLQAVASALHLSVRTLCRRLKAEGTSFQFIKDEVRRDIAVQKLVRTDQPITAVAFDVGFDNPATFYRAFRNWTGGTPGDYRRKAVITAP